MHFVALRKSDLLKTNIFSSVLFLEDYPSLTGKTKQFESAWQSSVGCSSN